MPIEDEIKALKFFFENHISADVTTELRRHGIDVLRSIEAGFPKDEPDESLLKYAADEGRIMVTCDLDFIDLDLAWRNNEKEHAGIIYISMMNADCKDDAKIIRCILFFHSQILKEESTYREDFYNQIKYTYHI